MSVILSEHDISFCETCSNCGGKLHFPYLEWHGKGKVAFCMRCCHKIKRGLVADLVHMDAMFELRAAGYNYLLVRENEQTYTARQERLREEERAMMKGAFEGSVNK
jgi:hypothetical protein